MVFFGEKWKRLVSLGAMLLAASPGIASAQAYRQNQRGGFGARGMEGGQRVRPNNNNGNNNNSNVGEQILGGLILGGALLESAARNQNPGRPNGYPPNGGYEPQYQPQYQPQYPQYQPQYVAPQPVYQPSQPVYQPPVAVTPAPNVVPAPNAVPAPVAAEPTPKANVVPTVAKKADVPKNAVGGKFALAGAAERSKVAKALDKQVREEVKDLKKAGDKAGLNRDDIAEKAEDLAKGATPDQLKDLSAAVEDGDAKKVDKILKSVPGVSDADRREVTAKVAASKALEDYEDALRAGGSSGAVADAKGELDDALDRLEAVKPGSASKLEALRTEADGAEQLSDIRDLIKMKPDALGGPGGWITSPDQLVIVDDPSLPPGTTMALGPNVFVTGGGSAMAAHPGSAADLGIPYVDGTPVADAAADSAAGPGVTVYNPKETGGSINYMVATFPYEMKAGESQTLPGGKSWVISFDRGGSNGRAEYTLSEGSYEFFVGDRGWDLRGKSFTVTLDNSANSHEFNYVANGEAGVVPARQTKTVQGNRPIVLVFDRGDGQEPARKELSNGVYQVGVDLRSQSLQLFPIQDTALVEHTSPRAPLSPRGN